MTSWGHDPSEIPLNGALTMLLDALQHSAVLVQAVALRGETEMEESEAEEDGGMATAGEARTMTVAFPRKYYDDAFAAGSNAVVFSPEQILHLLQWRTGPRVPRCCPS